MDVATADEVVVELKIVERASDNTIGRMLKNSFKPHLQEQWVMPPDANAAFVANMEDVLEVYHRPHDPEYPVVCVDKTSKQPISETRVPIKATPGQPARHDYEYERNGTANLFMMFAPLEVWRHVEVTDRHTAVDFAHMLRDLSDTHFPKAKKIVLIEDNLNTHKPASLYEAFPRCRGPQTRRAVRMALYARTRPTWPSPNSACCRANVSIVVSPISRRTREAEAVVPGNVNDSGQ